MASSPVGGAAVVILFSKSSKQTTTSLTDYTTPARATQQRQTERRDAAHWVVACRFAWCRVYSKQSNHAASYNVVYSCAISVFAVVL